MILFDISCTVLWIVCSHFLFFIFYFLFYFSCTENRLYALAADHGDVRSLMSLGWLFTGEKEGEGEGRTGGKN